MIEVPDKFNVVDMGGIDVVESQGVAVEGLFSRLLTAIQNCRYQVLYNWKFAKVEIVPSYAEVLFDGEKVSINELITVTEDDVVHIYSLEPEPPEPPTPSVVLSGTQLPTEEIGEDEQLYVQYYEAVDSNFEYGITDIYRKVSGDWEPYTEPEDRYLAVHIWTKSIGGSDASLYVQYGRFINDTFVPTGEPESVVYTEVPGAQNAKDCRLVNLYYNSGGPWTLIAKRSVVFNGASYSEGQTVATWQYNVSVNYIITLE